MTPERLAELRSLHPPHAAPSPPCLLCEVLTALAQAQADMTHIQKLGCAEIYRRMVAAEAEVERRAGPETGG